MAKNDERIEITLPSEQKNKWEEFEENTDAYASMSDLVRKSVEKEIGLDDRTRELGEMKEELVAIYSNLNIQMKNLNSDFEEMRGELPTNEDLYNINHDSTIDAVDKVLEDAEAREEFYRK